MTIGDLQIKRKSLDIRQDALARRLGWNRETLIDFERGRVKEDPLRQINDALEELKSEKREEVMA